jgi:hypothetical protein
MGISPNQVQYKDQGLTDFASKYTNSQFIADAICPPVPVSVLSGKFKKASRDDVTEVVDDLAGGLGKVNTVMQAFTDDSFTTDTRSLQQPVSRNDTVGDSPLDPEQAAVANVMQRIKLNHERRVATIMLTAANYASANQITASNAWSNLTSGTPVADILGALEKMPGNGDDTKIVAACSDVVFNKLRQHPTLLQLKGMTSGLLSAQEILEYFGIDEIHVSKVSYNTAAKGLAASYSRVWSSTQFVLTTQPRTTPSAETSVFAVSFRHGSFDVMKWFDPSEGGHGADIVKVTHDTHAAKIIQSDMGVLISSV